MIDENMNGIKDAETKLKELIEGKKEHAAYYEQMMQG
jgi:hypothetical protein